MMTTWPRALEYRYVVIPEVSLNDVVNGVVALNFFSRAKTGTTSLCDWNTSASFCEELPTLRCTKSPIDFRFDDISNLFTSLHKIIILAAAILSVNPTLSQNVSLQRLSDPWFSHVKNENGWIHVLPVE